MVSYFHHLSSASHKQPNLILFPSTHSNQIYLLPLHTQHELHWVMCCICTCLHYMSSAIWNERKIVNVTCKNIAYIVRLQIR